MSFDNIFGFILLFGLLVFLHEFGHFVVAKWSGIYVEVFSLGFGPRLFGWRGAETDYRVSLVPLGGYVKMLGEGPEAEWVDDPRQRRAPQDPGPEKTDAVPALEAATATRPVDRSFANKPRSQRLMVMVAGASMNLVLAVLILTALNIAGRRQPAFLDHTPRLASVEPDSPASRVGLLRGDRVVAVDGVPIADWAALQQAILFNPGKTIQLTVDRDGQELHVPVPVLVAPENSPQHKFRTGYIGLGDPAFDVEVWSVEDGSAADAAGLQVGDRLLAIDDEAVLTDKDVVRLIQARPNTPTRLRILRGDVTLDIEAVPADNGGKGLLGIAPGPTVVVKQYALWPAFTASLTQNVDNAAMFFQVVGRLVTGRLSMRAVSGPVEIFVFSGRALRRGWYTFLNLMALFSLQLGILNLLPIPFLDGGHVAILLVEGVIRRDLSEGLKERLLQAGFVALLLFMGVVLYFDIAKLIGW
ncbi:MAG: RIP metalloprotease RseP [Acidobacteriota bacterium]